MLTYLCNKATSHCHDATHPNFIFHPDQNITVQSKCLNMAGNRNMMMLKLLLITWQSNQNGISIVSLFVVLIQANVETFIWKNENV